MHTYTANVVYGDVWSKAGSCFEGIEEAKAQGHCWYHVTALSRASRTNRTEK